MYDVAGRARAFWREAQVSPTHPVDIEAVACWALPLGVVDVPDLTTSSLARWLGRRSDLPEQALHAALLARRGRGLILVDREDEPNERRVSIAHESAHFIVDYLEPRERALKRLGASIRDVLDGDRPPTIAERVDSLLASVPLGLHIHLIERDLTGRSAERALEEESRADALALELLAPADEVFRRAGPRPEPDDVAGLLTCEFGLPTGIAETYSRLLVPKSTPSFREWLGI